jgi:hypothetical protein
MLKCPKCGGTALKQVGELRLGFPDEPQPQTYQLRCLACEHVITVDLRTGEIRPGDRP